MCLLLSPRRSNISFTCVHNLAQFALRGTWCQVIGTNSSGGSPVWREGGVGQVTGVIVGSCGSCGGRINAQGQRGHAEGILGRGVGPETTEILFWYRTRGDCIGQLPGKAEGKRREGKWGGGGVSLVCMCWLLTRSEDSFSPIGSVNSEQSSQHRPHQEVKQTHKFRKRAKTTFSTESMETDSLEGLET